MQMELLTAFVSPLPGCLLGAIPTRPCRGLRSELCFIGLPTSSPILKQGSIWGQQISITDFLSTGLTRTASASASPGSRLTRKALAEY